MVFGKFQFITDLQYKVKRLQYEVDAFKSDEKYIKMNLNFQKIYAEKDREVKRLQKELADAHAQIVTTRESWMQVFEDMQAEQNKEIQIMLRQNKTLENRALNAERKVDELKEEKFSLKRQNYELQTELEEESAKNQKLKA